jgi:hypothetical protein
MSRIRIPNSALEILPFCQTSQARHREILFTNYAAMITMAAAYGFYHSGRRVPESKKFLASPEPIDLAIFRSQDLFPQLLMLSLACADELEGEDPLNEDYICRLIENLAALGLKSLSALLASSGGPSTFVTKIGEEQAKACNTTI